MNIVLAILGILMLINLVIKIFSLFKSESIHDKLIWATEYGEHEKMMYKKRHFWNNVIDISSLINSVLTSIVIVCILIISKGRI